MNKRISLIFLLIIIAALCTFGGVYYFKYNSSVKTENSIKKNEIIFGIGTTVLSNNMELDSLIKKAIKDNNLTFGENDYKDDINTKLLNLIENDKNYAEIKKITNKIYSVYNEDGKVGEFYGKYTQGWFSQYRINFDEKNADGLFISGDYNHMPRKIKILVSLRNDQRNYFTISNVDYKDKQLIEVGKKLLSRKDGIVISQAYECDLNGDNKIEKIVNYNNAFSDANKISENYMNMKKEDFEKYYAVIVVLNENNEVIDYIQNRPCFAIESVKDFVAYGGDLFTKVGYICDIDNDNNMEITSMLSAWEGVGYRFTKLINNMLFSTDRYFMN